MKFKVIDKKTGKEADAYEIALHEEWAKGLVYCDMEGFAITENGDLMLADECGNSVYCDPERFKVVFEDEERPHGEWICKGAVGNGTWCSSCDAHFSIFPNRYNFCPNCGADMRKDNEAKEKKPCPCDTCPTAIARCGCQMHLCSDYQKWKEGDENGTDS